MIFSTRFFLFYAFLLLTLFPGRVGAEAYVTNEAVRVDNERVIIEYDLPEGEMFKTTLKISVDGGETFRFSPDSTRGDIGANLSGASKRVIWEYKEEGVIFEEGKFLFQLKGFPQSFDMVSVDGGCFDMGDTFGEGWRTERPVHKVCVGDFLLSSYEITQGEWTKIMKSNPSEFKECGENCPVENVSLIEVLAFIKALNIRTGHNYRLPTEGEWEYAARNGGKRVRFGTGKNTLSDKDANFDARSRFKEPYSESGMSRGGTLKVGSFSPNALELFDMSGNVWEWLNGRFSNDSYDRSRVMAKSKAGKEEFVVIRGGGWKDKPKSLRTSRRSRVSPYFRSSDLGFRLAVTKF